MTAFIIPKISMVIAALTLGLKAVWRYQDVAAQLKLKHIRVRARCS